MEVATEKCEEKLDEPPVIPIKAALSSTPRQLPLLESSSDYPVWKFKVTAYLQRVPLTEHFNYLVSYLSDEAIRRATANGFATSNTLSQNWRILDDCFSVPVDTQQATIQFLSRHQRASKNPIDYLYSLQQIAAQAFPRLDVIGREESIRSRFVQRLLPGTLREHFLRSPPKDTSDLKRTTLRFLAADKLANLSDARPASVMNVEQAANSSGLDKFQTTSAVNDSFNRGVSRGQLSSRQNGRSPGKTYRNQQTECFYCKRFGENARKCGHDRMENRDRRDNIEDSFHIMHHHDGIVFVT
ncbi:unnamed protein product [Schistosoma spindalis]|nr:unnamed protein product [Schistosoma spindale]